MPSQLRHPVWFCCLVLLSLFYLASCSINVPAGVTPVTPFDIARYAGKWHEIARLDHSFERGLTNVSADYRVRQDGSVEVINRGYNPIKKTWRQAVGHALFTGGTTMLH